MKQNRQSRIDPCKSGNVTYDRGNIVDQCEETDPALKAIRINGYPYAAIKPGEDILKTYNQERIIIQIYEEL